MRAQSSRRHLLAEFPVLDCWVDGYLFNFSLLAIASYASASACGMSSLQQLQSSKKSPTPHKQEHFLPLLQPQGPMLSF